MNRPRRLLAVSAAAGLLVALPACGDDEVATVPQSGDVAETTETTAAPADDVVTASGAWARPSAMMQMAGAIYLDLTGGASDDALVEAAVPAEVAAVVEIHETVMMDDDGMDGDGMGDDGMHGDDMGDDGMHGDDMDGDMPDGMGMMRMREVGRIDVPAGATVVLEPGGLHIMLLELAEPLEPGTTFDVTLTFESGTTLVVPVEVRAS